MAETNLGINVTGRDTGGKAVMQGVRSEIDRLVTGLRSLENVTDQTNQELAESIINYRKASQESIALKGAWKQLERTGQDTEEQFQKFSQRIREVQTREREAIEETRKLAMAFTSSEENAEQFGGQLRLLNEQLDKSQGFIDGVRVEAKQTNQAITGLGSEVKQLGQATKDLAVDAKRGADGIERVGDESRRAADGIDKVKDSSRRAADELKKMNDGAAGSRIMANIISEAMEEAIYAIGRFASEGIQEFWDFDRGMREISTLIPGHTDEMREAMSNDIQALSIDLGRMSEETLPAVYQALSSGRGTETVLEDVALASEAARASVGELEGTMASGLAVINAYGEGAYTLQQVYDQFFYGIKEGVFTMDDLAGGMSALTSISAETKTPLEDIMAALVVMTRQGDGFNEAVELSGLLLTQLGTEGSAAAKAFVDATGQSYRDFIAQGGTLAEALQMIQDHAADTGKTMGEMIAGNSPFYRDQQAARAALELTGVHLQELADFADGARDAQGSMAEASAIMGEAAEAGALRAKAGFDVLKAQVGEAILAHKFWGSEYISISQAIDGAATLMEAKTGAMNTSIEDLIAGNIAAADSTADLVAEFERLEKADDMYLGLGDVITGTTDAIKGGQEDVREALMKSFDTYSEYTNYLQRLPPEIFKVMAANDFQNQVIFEEIHAREELIATSQVESDEKQASIALMRQATEARQRERTAILYSTAAMEQQIRTHGMFAQAAEPVTTHLVNQSVAAQEAMHGLDIYRESLGYAATANESLSESIDSEELFAQAEALAGYWSQAEGLVDTWVAAQEEGAAAIIAANQAISASYDETFVNALLKTEGLTKADMDAMVAAGLLSQAEADLQWQIASTNQEITLLTEAQGFNKLTAEQQAEAFRLLKEGMATTAEGAVALATNGYNGVLTPALADAKLEALALKEPLDGMSGMMVAPEFVAPDLSGAISQAERLKQLLDDLANQGSAGGYGGHQNDGGGGVQGGGNIPQNATGTSYFQGGLSWVGEQGPELVSLPRGSQIHSNRDSVQMASKTVNVGGDTFIMNNRGMDEAQAAAHVVATRRRERMNAAARIN